MVAIYTMAAREENWLKPFRIANKKKGMLNKLL